MLGALVIILTALMKTVSVVTSVTVNEQKCRAGQVFPRPDESIENLAQVPPPSLLLTVAITAEAPLNFGLLTIDYCSF